MSYKPSYQSGDWKAVCDICGQVFKASELRQRWDGFKVCSKDFEYRQPQDFVRGVADITAPPWTKPESQDLWTGLFSDYNILHNSIAGVAIAGYAIAGVISPITQLPVPPSSFT
jgi:hypothetical protein